ncbi:MAG: PAS domain-containing protein, partial [Candidatus Poribacteria bacterium]
MRQDNIVTDGQRTRRTLFRSIRTKLIVNFILVFVAIFVIVEWIEIRGVPFTPYSGRRGEQRAEAFRSLNLIADLKKERLLRWMEERRDDTHMIAASEFIAANVVQLRAAIREFAAEGREEAELWALVRKEGTYRALVRYLDTVRDTYEIYDRIQVADAETGKIFVSTDDTVLGTDVSQHQYPCFSEALKTRALYVSDIKMDLQSQHPALHFSDIIKDQEGEAVAVLIMEVNVDDIIKPMLHTGEGLDERGEALLVNQDVKILTSLKHPLADGSIAEPLEYQITAKPAVLAANGEEGIIESEDYRGEPVLAAYRYIRVSSQLGWGMVVKRDRAELFAPLRRDMIYTLLTELGGILAVVLLTIVTAKNIAGPIRSLSRTAAQVAEGNLDARASATTSDEVGMLSTTFNSMVQRIQNWREELEEQVHARTVELRALNEELMKEIAERKRTEEALAEERNLLRTIIDNLPDYIYVKDTEGRYLVSNIAHVRFLGAATLDEVVGKTVFELFPRELAAQYHADDREIIRSGQPLLNREERSVDGTGNSIWNLTTKVPLRDSHRKIIGLVGIARDITERKRAEEERNALIKELEAKNSELERFTYTVSHDLKSPL